jgi:hypothetical protein
MRRFWRFQSQTNSENFARVRLTPMSVSLGDFRPTVIFATFQRIDRFPFLKWTRDDGLIGEVGERDLMSRFEVP